MGMKSPDLSPASRERATDFREESRGRLGLRPARRARWCPPFVLGLNTQIAQLLILREAMILSSGSETALGLCLGAWALLNGVGALGGWWRRLFGRILPVGGARGNRSRGGPGSEQIFWINKNLPGGW